MPKFNTWSTTSDLNTTFTINNFSGILLIMTGMMLTLNIVHQSLGKHYGAIQYVMLLVIVFICSIIGSNSVLKASGMGTSIWCIFFGIALRLALYKVYSWVKSSIYDL
jgi:hypothetical protein